MQVRAPQRWHNFGIDKDDVIGITGRRLHLSAHQQRVLMRDQQFAVEGNRRPAARVHEHIVKRLFSRRGLLLQLRDLRRAELAGKILFG